jgi:hypothetical protein
MIRKIMLSLSLMLASNAVQASMADRLADFISEEVWSMDNAFVRYASSNPASVDEEFFLRRFWLRVRAKFGIEVPGLAEFDVIPEVEMLWEKQTPEGYEIYRP